MGDPVEALIKLLARLPGVGTKTATRLAFHLIAAAPDYPVALADALQTMAETVRPCDRCRNYTADGTCAICRDPRRNEALLCVVSRVQDLLALERAGGFRGQYFVLGGLLSPLDGIGPDEIAVSGLMSRLEQGGVDEVILAISPSVEGETTALYLAKLIKPLGARITRIAAGVPIGGELEYTDQVTLGRAMADRKEI